MLTPGRYRDVCFGFGGGSAPNAVPFSMAMRFFGDSPVKRGRVHGTSRYVLNDLQTGYVAPMRKVWVCVCVMCAAGFATTPRWKACTQQCCEAFLMLPSQSSFTLPAVPGQVLARLDPPLPAHSSPGPLACQYLAVLLAGPRSP